MCHLQLTIHCCKAGFHWGHFHFRQQPTISSAQCRAGDEPHLSTALFCWFRTLLFNTLKQTYRKIRNDLFICLSFLTPVFVWRKYLHVCTNIWWHPLFIEPSVYFYSKFFNVREKQYFFLRCLSISLCNLRYGLTPISFR